MEFTEYELNIIRDSLQWCLATKFFIQTDETNVEAILEKLNIMKTCVNIPGED